MNEKIQTNIPPNILHVDAHADMDADGIAIVFFCTKVQSH